MINGFCLISFKAIGARGAGVGSLTVCKTAFGRVQKSGQFIGFNRKMPLMTRAPSGRKFQ
jgi:hypothetical protein